MTSETFNYADGGVEGTGSGTISPRTVPSSTDDNFHAHETWPHFQLFNSASAEMSLETPMLYPYAKGPNPSTGAVIVDDVGDLSQDQGFSDDVSAEALMFQQVPPSFPLMTEQWSSISHGLPMDDLPSQGTMSLGMDSQNNSAKNPATRDFTSVRSLETRWLNSLESQLPASQVPSAPVTPAHTTQHNAQATQDGFQYKSENSSVSGDVPGIHECSFSATSEDPPTLAERRIDDELQWKIITPDDGSPDASGPKTTAFMVSETPPESLISTIPSRSNPSSAGQRASGRPTTLAMQSVATVRKRKNRNTQASSEQSQPKPLQIVQEDGQGGSIASADFVSPPRGARRKGPLSMVGRANAGLRRKNKDTCVQCRLNKRKCDGSSPCDACRPTLHEQPCARACFSSIVEFGTCNYICMPSPHPQHEHYRKTDLISSTGYKPPDHGWRPGSNGNSVRV